MADILRSIADELEGHNERDRANNSAVHAELEPVGIDFTGDEMKHEEGDGTTMVPPLQQKLELLKKASGVPSAFDGNDELDDIKKLTGITAVIHGDDTDLEGQ